MSQEIIIIWELTFHHHEIKYKHFHDFKSKNTIQILQKVAYNTSTQVFDPNPAIVLYI